jgi:uncharacterized protein YjbJ (UPF0337 family)
MDRDMDRGGSRDILEGNWKQLRGQLKEWWGKLTDDDLDRIEGKRDKLIGMLQERYGYAKADAEREIEQRFSDYDYDTGFRRNP